MWFVYILKCSDDTLYTGVTNNIEKRLNEHNHTKLGAKYTMGRRPLVLVYKKKFKNRSEAQIEEAKIKKLKRGEKLLLIKSKYL